MLNFETYKALDSKCVKLAKQTHNTIDAAIRRKIVNSIIYRAYGALETVDSPFWNRTIALTVAADQEHLKDTVTNGGTITAIDSTTKTITRSAGTFPAGALVDIVVVTKATSLVAGQWKARITVAGAAATYVKIGSGTEVTFNSATQACFVNVMKTLSASSASIADQYVKNVVSVFDDQGTSGNRRVFDHVDDPRVFSNLHDEPFRVSSICWRQEGDTIFLFVGEDATAPGVVQAEVVSKPTIFTEATAANAIDLPPELNEQITDEVVAAYLMQAGNAVPDDLQKRLAEYQTRYQSKAASKQEAAEVEQHKSE